MTTNANIILKAICVNGVNTQRRASTFKEWFVRKKSLTSTKIPILTNLSFEAKHGDKIALIGMNGSGKSSLLKVISGIYPVDSGYYSITGKVSPLIEMGLGFDPELSGRSNIKLSFAFRGKLALYNDELEEKIIKFSELEDKIDVPMKTYSSGMQSRLAFASVIFQEPEILLLDEVFAVGDRGFVKKAQKFVEAQLEASTIAVLVNHSIDDIKRLCNRFILIHEGTIIMEDSLKNVLRKYELDILKFITNEPNQYNKRKIKCAV